MKKISALPSGAYCFTRREEGRDGPLEGGDQALGPSRIVGDALAEIEGRIEVIEMRRRTATTRPRARAPARCA